MKIGFDTKKYLVAQEKAILERLNKTKKLYLEFGGKLLFDAHASRVLPGYDPQAKLLLLKRLKKDLEILVCVSAKELQRRKFHPDFNLDYEEFTLKILGELKNNQLLVTAVVINRFEGERAALDFEKRLKRLGFKTYKRREIPTYPTDIDLIASKRGFGADPFVKTSKPIVLVTAPSPNSGKMSTCLGQLYHEYQRGTKASYAKFETFPVWDLPLNHPVNVAYEAATADLGDFNLIDPFHLETYGTTAVNYNRDVEAFPILQKILKKIMKEDVYFSPTDMGVNCISKGIIDDKAVRNAACQEVIFRFFRYQEEIKRGLSNLEAIKRVEVLMKKLGLKPEDRKVVPAARQALKEAEGKRGRGEKGIYCGAAIEVANGQIVTGKNSPLLHAEAAAILNAIKVLAGIPDKTHLLPPNVIGGINKMKQAILKEKSESLNVSEVLTALAIATINDPSAKRALKFLPKLKNCKMHTTHVPSPGDKSAFRKLGLWVSTDAQVSSLKPFYY